MKILKRLFIGLIGLVVLLAAVVVVAANMLDPNDHKNFIENKTQSLIGRELSITGDIKLSYFPWVGIKLGELELANAEGFSDKPFAKIDHANVKVELLPLLRKVVNAKTVELAGLEVNLQRAADGSTNWDDLANREPATTSTTEDNTTTEVEGEPAAIAALAVGGLDVADAVINWQDDLSGTDATISDFDLTTGAIELAKPFDLENSFQVASQSLGLTANVKSGGNVTLDLAEQRYALNGLTFETDATGDMFPHGKLDLSMATSLLADLSAQTVDATELTLGILGVTLAGNVAVTQLDTEPQVSATLKSETFSPRELFTRLGIEAPVTADEKVLNAASVSMALAASPAAAMLQDLTITLDDTTFKGQAELPNLAAQMPPVRFDFGVDAIDLDRYLPPTSDTADATEDASGDATSAAAAEDTPIDLPVDLMRQLDVVGTFSVGELKILNLTTREIAVPLKAEGGVISLENIAAQLYEGNLASTLALNVKGDTPVYTIKSALTKVESDPLLADLQQSDSPLSGNANFNADLQTVGNSVNGLKAGLNGTFDAAFLDGSINGINIGYQLRRAKAAIKGQSLSDDQKQVKTDFSSLSISGTFTDGVMTSDDLDMRSPLLRLSGGGLVDLPQEYLDYTPSILVSGTTEGQGGKDLEDLKGLQLDLPLKGKFDELSADFTGVLLAGLKSNISGAAKAKAKAAADKLKNEAKAKLDAEKARAKEQLAAKKAEAKVKAEAELAAKKEQISKKAKDKLKGSLNKLLK